MASHRRDPGAPAIDVRALSKLHGSTAALLDATFAVEPGTILRMVGASGSGKSTLVKLLAGHLMPSGGRIRIGGLDVKAARLAVASHIAYVPQVRPAFGDMRTVDILRLSGCARGMKAGVLEQRIASVAGLCGLRGILHAPSASLPNHARARTALAQALLHEPSVLLLDELLTGLDDPDADAVAGLLEGLAGRVTTILSGPPSLERVLRDHPLGRLERGRLTTIGVPAERLLPT